MMDKAELEKTHAKYKKQYDGLAIIHKHATDMLVLFDKVDTDKAKRMRLYVLNGGAEGLLEAIRTNLVPLELVMSGKLKGSLSETLPKAAIKKLDDLFAKHDKYPRVFIQYAEEVILHCNENFTRKKSQETLLKLEDFLEELPEELFSKDDLTSIKAKIAPVKQKMIAHETTDDKDGLAQKQKDEHTLLAMLNDKAKAELERNKKLLQELTTEKHALEKNLSSERHTLIELTTETNRLQHLVTFLKKEQDSFQEERLPRLRHEASELLTTCDKLKDETLPHLRYEADELQAMRDKLKTEVDALKEKIGTLQKEAEVLQADADATRGHKAKSALEDNIPPLSASHAQLNAEENALKEKRLLEQGKVTGILEKFNTNIAKMKPKTQKVAESLAKKFANYAEAYFKTERTEQNKKEFIASCRQAVDIEKPTLNDVGFWRKVQNMLTALWNAITPAGINMNFFKTDLANKTESTLSDLENIKGMNQ